MRCPIFLDAERLLSLCLTPSLLTFEPQILRLFFCPDAAQACLAPIPATLSTAVKVNKT